MCNLNRPPAPCKAGDRIRLIQMGEDPNPIPPGATGTVISCAPGISYYEGVRQIMVRWDPWVGRDLNLVWPIDQFEVISDSEEHTNTDRPKGD